MEIKIIFFFLFGFNIIVVDCRFLMILICFVFRVICLLLKFRMLNVKVCRVFLVCLIERKLFLSKLLCVSCFYIDFVDVIRFDLCGWVVILCFNLNWRVEYCLLVSLILVKLMMSLLGFGCILFFLCFFVSRFWNLFLRWVWSLFFFCLI